jgi:hypothetical protein
MVIMINALQMDAGPISAALLGRIHIVNRLAAESLHWINWRSIVRKTFPAICFAVSVLFALNLFGPRAYGQDQDNHQKKDHPNGIVQDWSRRHVLYPRFGPIQSMIALQNDPRAVLSWQEAIRRDWHREKDRQPSHSTQTGFHRDWSISLGSGTTAPSMFPAKYNFNADASVTSANCASDFTVFPVNVNGSASQPNIVGFNNLYSGSTPGVGLCNRTPNGGVDDGVSATVIWSYDIEADTQNIASTSPALSLDGTKVAFVESDPGTDFAYFTVLAPHSGDGVATNLQTVTSPKQITSFSPNAPVAGSGTATSLQIFNRDTRSSPFVDYENDRAYVGDDFGNLYRIINVFCVSPACTGGGSPAPSLDSSWPTGTGGGVLATGCGGVLTGPVVDAVGNVFVGCSNGQLYGFDSNGTQLSGSPVTVGSGGTDGGIVDPPVVDAVRGYIYVVSGNSSGTGTPSVLAQAQVSGSTLSLISTATLGQGGRFNLHSPSFNAAYFSSVTPSDWLIYEWGLNSAGTLDAVYGITFGTGHVMTPGAAGNSFAVPGSVAAEFSPSTEFLNGATDQLFVSAQAVLTPNVVGYIINTFPTAFPPTNNTSAAGATATEGAGTSGIIVDNNSADSQASSIYFGVQTSNTAVKLTQSTLQ